MLFVVLLEETSKDKRYKLANKKGDNKNVPNQKKNLLHNLYSQIKL